MATANQTARDKFLELRKTGVDAVSARKQAYGEVAPAQTGGVVQAQPVSTEVAPVSPAPIVNAPVEQTTGLSKPLEPVAQPTPAQPVATTPVNPTAPKVDATPGITQDSFNQAKAESEKIKAQNEAQMALNKQQAELKNQERQQIAQETAKANTPVNQKDVLNALVSGVSVAPQNTKAYRNAQFQYKNYQKFATMTPSQLVDNMKMGEIGTETAQLLAGNPSYIKAKEDFEKFQKNQSINNMIKSVAQGATGKMTEVDHYQNASDSIAKKLGVTETNADAFARIVSQDPETLELTKTVSNIAKQLNTLNTERNAVYADLKKQYPTLSASAIMTLMAGRTKEATDQINALNSSLTLTQADLKMAMEMAQNEYQATQADITLQSQLAQEDRAMQNALALSQAQFEQGLAQQTQLTNDPTTAIRGVIKQFADLGIIGDRNLAWHVAEQKRLGMTLPEYTKKMIEDFKAKPEYKSYQDKQTGTEWQSTSITRYNPSTGANESTPVFYRKKTDGSFEAVDLSGNKIDASAIGGGISGTPGAISATGDMSGLASNYPYEASFKNNNTSGITWGMSARTKGLLEKAGIKISEGTARPSREGGKYVKFDNIADGLLAHKILLSQAGSDDINARLQQWVGTKEGPTYAKNLMDQAGIKAGTKFSQLTPEQLDKLVMVQVKKESPGMYKELTKGTTQNKSQTVQSNPLQVKEFEAYNGTTIPAQYKTPLEQDDFVKRYNEWRASRPLKKIETGNDILNIRLDKGGTEGEKLSQSYTSRMLNAVNNLIPLEKKFLELGTGGQVAQTYLPSLLKSSDQKMMDAEKKNFITAVLRKQSGASIAPSEFAGEEMKYFPQPGDSKEVIVAKQNARNAEIKAMLVTAGTDAEGNSLSTYYNPPVLVAEKTTAPIKTDKISTLKKNYFPQ